MCHFIQCYQIYTYIEHFKLKQTNILHCKIQYLYETWNWFIHFKRSLKNDISPRRVWKTTLYSFNLNISLMNDVCIREQESICNSVIYMLQNKEFESLNPISLIRLLCSVSCQYIVPCCLVRFTTSLPSLVQWSITSPRTIDRLYNNNPLNKWKCRENEQRKSVNNLLTFCVNVRYPYLSYYGNEHFF